MDSSDATLDTIESQRSTVVSNDQRRRSGYFPMNLIKKGARILSSKGNSQSGGDSVEPPTGVTDSVTEFLNNLRLSDLYNLPGESVAMDPEIHSAVRAGDEKTLEKLRSCETPMACFKNDKGDSILHLAATFGHLGLVKSIVSECPCLLLEPNWKGQIPLHLAARAGHSAVVEALVSSVTYFSARLSEEDRGGLNVYVLKDKNGDTPLHLALKYLQEIAELLMLHQQRFRNLGVLTRSIRSCVRNESICGSLTFHMETATCLVTANQRASFLANKDGVSPLYLAIENGDVSLVKAMLNRPNVQGKTSNLASQLEGRKSLVHVALKAKNIEVLDVILNEDPSLVSERDEDGRTCLSVGASLGYYEGICNLLDRSTSNVYERDDNGSGSFPIHMAVEKSHFEVVKEILKRCPHSKELLNKKGQNILHIAAKSGNDKSLLFYIKKLDTKKHLMVEQDLDGNTPLHLATIMWRPRTINYLIMPAPTKTKILNQRNKDGLTALDIAKLNLQSQYVFRERMTMMILLSFYSPRGIPWLPSSGMTLRSISEKLGGGREKYKDCVNILLVVATLIATMTFAAGFTMPGGFNSSAPNSGMAILAKDPIVSRFLFFDTVAMQSSVVAIVALIWAQLGDQELAHSAFHLALPSLFAALWSMSLAFTCGVQATIKQNIFLALLLSSISAIFNTVTVLLLTPYVIPQVSGVSVIHNLGYVYLAALCWLVKEDNAEEPLNFGSGHTCVKKVESVESSTGDQLEKSKDL